MTDIITDAPIKVRDVVRPRLAMPKIGFGADVMNLAQVIGQAYALAFAAPFGPARPTPNADAELQERDPRW